MDSVVSQNYASSAYPAIEKKYQKFKIYIQSSSLIIYVSIALGESNFFTIIFFMFQKYRSFKNNKQLLFNHNNYFVATPINWSLSRPRFQASVIGLKKLMAEKY